MLMESFEEATNCVQGECRVTVSNVIPSIHGLRHKLNSVQCTYCKPLITDLHSAINTRLAKYESSALYFTGAVLDPRFKLQWCQSDETEQIKNTVISEMQKYAETSVSAQPATVTSLGQPPESAEEPVPKKLKLFTFMHDSSPQSSQPHQHDLPLTLRQELMDYIRSTSLEYDSNPLVWWKSHACDFPHVARTAKAVLSLPASSAPVERILSSAGKIFCPERTRLTEENFAQLVFIKCNKCITESYCHA